METLVMLATPVIFIGLLLFLLYVMMVNANVVYDQNLSEAAHKRETVMESALFVATIYRSVGCYGTWTHSTWSQLGIPGPKPLPLLGNLKEIKQKGMFSATLEWCQTYGKVFGIYLTRKPILIVADLDIIKEVFIKDFANFSPRGLSPELLRYPINTSVVFAAGETWRRQRHTLTPCFTAAKLKLMGDLITKCCNNLCSSLQGLTEQGKPLEMKKVFSAFTLDVTAAVVYSIEMDYLKGKNNALFDAFQQISLKSNPSLAAAFAGMFPFLTPLLLALGCSAFPNEETEFVVRTVNNIIQERRTSKDKNPTDLLQLMIDTETTEEEIQANPRNKGLTQSEVVSQAFIIWLAGYDTTSSLLRYLFYLLAVNPETQEKLHDAIVAAIGDAKPSYETVARISYLDSCIFETLRMFPPAAFAARVALKTGTVKGVTIPEGCEVGLPICAVMRDEEYFPEPEKFTPERFENDNDPIPFIVKELAFGVGPRQCIGMRLALYEAKMVIAHVIRKFRFVKIAETPETVTMSKQTRLTTSPSRPLLVGTELRHT